MTPFLRFPDTENRQPRAKCGAQESAANTTVEASLRMSQIPHLKDREENALKRGVVPTLSPQHVPAARSRGADSGGRVFNTKPRPAAATSSSRKGAARGCFWPS